MYVDIFDAFDMTKSVLISSPLSVTTPLTAPFSTMIFFAPQL